MAGEGHYVAVDNVNGTIITLIDVQTRHRRMPTQPGCASVDAIEGRLRR
jgi:hypothetical protein